MEVGRQEQGKGIMRSSKRPIGSEDLNQTFRRSIKHVDESATENVFGPNDYYFPV